MVKCGLEYELKYTCEQCDFHTTLKYVLRVHHKSVHMGRKVKCGLQYELKYKCKQCDFHTTLKCDLRVHHKSVHVGKIVDNVHAKNVTIRQLSNMV